jgi:GNAT superfamily N-acetyltransferase
MPNIRSYPVGNGVIAISYFEDDFYAPKGTAWFVLTGANPTSANLLDIYIPEHSRRRGIGRAILNFLVKHHATIILTSISSSTPEGTAFVASYGFRKDPAADLWIYTRP